MIKREAVVPRTAWIVIAAGLALAGCQKKEEAPAPAVGEPVAGHGPRSRFVGIGLYAPGPMWRELVAPRPPSDPAAAHAQPEPAQLDDDEQVIVVVDSATGEVRQCGNLTGMCLAMNPWAQGVPQAWQPPARVVRHLEQIRAEDAAAWKAREAEQNRALAAQVRRHRKPR